MPARLFFRTKKLLKHFSKAFLLSAFLLVAVLGIASRASAQVDETYKEFYTLFDPSNATATFQYSKGTWKTPPEKTHANDLLFTFIGGFDFIGKQHDTKQWFWDHIKDFTSAQLFGSDRKDVFIIRLCPTDATGAVPNEGTNNDQSPCVFADAPYAEYCNNTDTCLDPAKPLDKIYHKLFDQHGRLGVNMNGLDFRKLGNGKLDKAANIELTPGGTYIADLWYCAAAGAAKDAGLPELTTDYVSTQSNPRLRNFNKLCGDQSKWPAYFQIAQTTPFTVPTTAAESQQANDSGILATRSDSGFENGEVLPSCGLIFSSGSFTGCIAQVVYYIIYRPVAWFAGIMGSLFDFFLGYSVSDESYRMDFVVTGWRIVRDISNIFFIVILIWAGLLAVFDSEKTSLKNVVVAVIVNALLINFSLFGTRVIVDLSNIVTRVFYNNIEVCEGACMDKDNDGKPDNIKKGAAQYKPLSEKIVSSFNPQTLFSAEYLNPSKSLPQNNASQSSLFNVSTVEGSQALDKDSSTYAGLYIIVALFGAVILFAVAVMFWKTSFMFLGRVIGIYVVMIFSPFAVLTRGNVPIFGNMEGLRWSDWWKELFNYAMLAPIFVFFLYVVYMFVDSDWMKFTQIGGGSFFEKVLAVGIPMLFIFILVKKGVDIAKKYAGTIGNMVQNFVNSTVGGVGGLIGGGVGLAAGGVGLIGRNVLGRGIGLAGKIGVGKRGADGKRTSLAAHMASRADSSAGWRRANNFMKWSKTSTWDPRNISAKVAGKEYTALGTFNKGVTLLGKPIGEAGPKDNISGKLGMGKDAGKDGIKEIDKKRVEARKKKINEKMNFDHLSDSEAKEAWQAHVEKKSLELAKPGAEHAYAMSKGGEYEKISKEIENKQTALAKLGEDITKQYAIMADPKTSSIDRDAAKRTITEKQNQFKNIDGEIRKLKGQQSAELEKIKREDPEYKNSKEYRDSLAAEKDKKRAEVDKYGKVENGKAFTAAMRAEYAEDLRKSSLWMWDDKKRWESQYGLGGGAAGGVLAKGLGLGLAGWAAPFAAALGMYVQSEADIMDQATKEIINATKKNKTVGTKKAKLTNHHKALQEELKAHLVAVDDTAKNKDIDDLLADDKYIEETLAARRIQLEQKLKNDKKNLDAMDATYKAETDPAKKDALKKTRDDAEIKLHIERAKYDRLSNLRNEVDRAEDALDRYTTKEAENEEKAKKKAEEGKGGGDKDKPKEGSK